MRREDTGLHRQWSATVLAEHRHQAPLAALIELLERDLPTAAVVPASVSGPALLQGPEARDDSTYSP